MIVFLLSAAIGQVSAEPTPSPVAEKKVCRTVQNVGSRMRHARDCRTRAEWRAREEAERAVNGLPGNYGSLSSLRSGAN